MRDIDQELQNLIQNDTLNFEVDPSSIHRLINHLKITSLRSSVHLNSFIPFDKLRNIRPLAGIKVGIACLLLIAIFNFRQLNTLSGSLSDMDSTIVHPTADTNNIFPLIDSTHSRL